MAAAIDAIDLVALLCVLLCIGLLMAVDYTFTQLANALDVSIAGTHPFSGIADAIRKYIISGVQSAISSLVTVQHDLWEGLKWSIDLTMDGIRKFVHAAEHGFRLLTGKWIPAFVAAMLKPVWKTIGDIQAALVAINNYAHTQVSRLDSKIDNGLIGLKTTLEGKIAGVYTAVESDLTHGLNNLRGTVEAYTDTAIAGAEKLAADALTKVAKAESAAISAVGQAEDLTAEQLHDFIHSVPLTDLEALLTAVPLLAALVDVALAESGLNRAECRGKVKGICGTDPTQWFNLLEGLALVGAGISLTEIFDLAKHTAQEAMPIVRDLVT